MARPLQVYLEGCLSFVECYRPLSPQFYFPKVIAHHQAQNLHAASLYLKRVYRSYTKMDLLLRKRHHFSQQ